MVSHRTLAELEVNVLTLLFRIETQNEFLQQSDDIERYVEIGPTKILATMAKKSASKQRSAEASSSWSHLQFLSSSDDKGSIYYEHPQIEDTVALDSVAANNAAATSEAAIL